jgi:hypothetical protein
VTLRMMMTGTGVLLLGLSCSCRSASAPQPAQVPTPPPLVAAPVAAQAPEVVPQPEALGPPAQQLLVHLASQEIVLLSAEAEGRRVLVPHADAALYQSELELIWFRDGERFGVVDLRKPDFPVFSLGHGMPDENRLNIERGSVMASTADACDLPFVALEWTESPELKAYITDAPGLGIDNQAWFAAELTRPTRGRAKRQSFSGARVRLPKKVLSCDLPDACGKTAPFGVSGKQLMLVIERTGGDCLERGCLLYDPSTSLFATPPKATTWAGAKQTAPGSCGPYLFDASKSAFLVDHRLCTFEQGCRDLGGHALGWLVPGENVGEPGTGNFDEG